MNDDHLDLNSPSNFEPTTPVFLRQLKETGKPLEVTINGQAELVIQDTASYQKMIELAERADDLEVTRQSVAEMKAGQGRSAEEMLGEMRQILAEKRGE